MSRSCARPGCSQGAEATLSYAYADSVVWLEDLALESHPMTHDMCRLHADAVRVPRGWELQDVRNGPGGTEPRPAQDRQDPNGAALRLVGA